MNQTGRQALIGARTVIGGLVGGAILYTVRFLFWQTPLSGLAYSRVDDAANAQLQASLAQILTSSGTGTYAVPWPGSGSGTVLYGKGPIALIHFNTAGFPVIDGGALISGLILSLIAGVLIALALGFAGIRTFAERVRIVALFAAAATLFIDMSQPVLNHHGYGFWLYAFIADFAALSLAGAVIARWFLPNSVAAAPAATMQ